jgi:hypothetical protein
MDSSTPAARLPSPAVTAPAVDTSQERALTPRSLFTGLSLSLVWTLAVCYMVVYVSTFSYQFLMVVGFGGLLTIFLLHFPRLYLAALTVCWAGTAGLAWLASTPDQKQLLAGGLVRSLPVLGLLALVGALQLRRRMTKAEAAAVYAMVAISIPWSVSVKACMESSVSNLLDSNRRQEKQAYQWARDMPWWGPTMRPPAGQAEHEARVLAMLAQAIQADDDRLRASILALPPTAFYYNDHRDVFAQMATLRPAKEDWQKDRYRPQFEQLSARIRWGSLRPASLLAVEARDDLLRESIATLMAREPQCAALDKAVEGFSRGSPDGSVPWGLWWRPMVYWAAMCGSYVAMLFGLLLMFRRRWIEHERLPFPWAMPVLSVMQDQGPSRRQWIAWWIGLGLCVPGISYASLHVGAIAPIPMLPWSGHQGTIFGGFDLTSLGLLYKTSFVLYWCPLILAMYLLMPTDVLLTIVVTYVLTALVGQSLLLSMGMDIGNTVLAAFRNWGIRTGGGAGLLIWGLYFNRNTIWTYLKGLMGAGRPTHPDQQDELGRGLVAGLFLAGLAGFFLLGCYATSWPMMLFLMVWVFVYVFAQVRQRAEGMLFTYENNITSHQLVSLQRDILHDHPNLVGNPAYPGAVATGNAWGVHWMAWAFAGQLKTFGPQNVLMEIFKIAHEVRANVRQIGLAILLAVVVVALLTPPLYLKLIYTYGFENTYQEGWAPYQSFTQWSERACSYGIHSTSRVYINPGAGSWFMVYQAPIWMLVGIVIVGGLTYLRREYVWFPFSPVGFVLASEVVGTRVMYYTPDTMWFTVLLAWVLKKLVFRWLGVRYYNERMLPSLLYLLMGIMFGMLLYILRYVSMGKGFLS